MQKTAFCAGMPRAVNKGRRSPCRALIKTLLVMKLMMLLLTAAFVQVHATGLAQSVSFTGNNVPLRKVLEAVEKQTGYFVFYSSKSLLQKAKPVSVTAKDMPLKEFLSLVLEDGPYTFELEENTISLRRKPASRQADASLEYLAAPPDKVVAGVVMDANGITLPGATVQLENTAVTVVTDGRGRFRLANVPEGGKVTITSVGFAPLTLVNMNGRIMTERRSNSAAKDANGEQVYSTATGPDDKLVVKLVALVSEMEEVVITGMFQRSERTYTGAAKTITGQELKKISATNLFAGISAIEPSFRVIQNNITGGNINQLPEIQLRGANSFPNLSGEIAANPNAPLFILDGFEVTLQRVADLDINLVATVTILKDASATAIYGSRGANGVMVITTLVPKAGKLQVTFNNDYRFTTPDLSVYNMLDAKDKLNFEKRAGVYTGVNNVQQYLDDYLYNERHKAMVSGVNTNWLKIPVQNGHSNRSSLYLQGGDQSVRYGLQLAADLQSGVMKGQNRNNYSGQFDLTYLVKKLQFKNSIRIFNNRSNESPYGSFSEYVIENPYWTPYDANGKVKKYLEYYTLNNASYRYIFQEANPMYDATLHSVNKTQYFGLSNNFQMRYSVLPNLYVETNLSINKQNGATDQFYSAEDSRFNLITDVNQKGSYTVRNDNSSGYESITTANFNLARGPHQLFSTLAYNFSSNNSSYYSVVTEGFPFDRLDNLLFAAQYQANGRPTGDESTIRRVGLVYSGNYSYDNRFLADISARRDGSSQFGTDQRFGTFWSTGLGWNIHNEKPFKGNRNINRLKLRGSYGATGSLNIPAYSAQTRYTFGVSTTYYDELGAVLSNLGNKSLSWQNVKKLNVGLDMVLFRERFDLRVDLYREDSYKTLTQITLAPSSGFTSYNENLGHIRNTGLEFSARWKILQNGAKGLLWSVNVNGFTNKNVLKALSNALKASNDKLDEANTEQTVPNILFREGESLNTIYVVRSLGVDPATGSEVFVTKEGKPTYTWNAADKVAAGISQPAWNGNFGSNFQYKGLEVSCIFNYQLGGQLYNQTLIDRVESVNPKYNVDRRAYDLGWSGPGDVSQYTRIGTSTPATKLTSRFVQDNNNLTLTSASVGYNFYRSPLIKKMGLRSLLVTAITNDALRFSSIDIERGTSNPFARTYSLSLRASF